MKHILKKLHPNIRNVLREGRRRVLAALRTLYFKLFRSPNADIQGRDGILLNVGSGKLIREGWVNVDIEPGKGAFFIDMKKRMGFRNGSVRHIHCEHFLEHVEYPVARTILEEFYRVLSPGGTIRIISPDAERYFRAYCGDDSSFFDKLKNLGGAVEPFRTRIEIINQMFRMDGAHRFAWDFETLQLCLRDAGFVDVRRASFGDMPPDINIDGTDDWRIQESLYVNAAKPDTSPALIL